MSDKRFNIRVYAIVIDGDQVLLSDEIYNGIEFTKFPGGGLKWGEGPIDTLQRELMEELGVTPNSAEHFYTTEPFIQSAFNEDNQLLSIYYRVQLKDTGAINLVGEKEAFRWINLADLSPDLFRFPVDQIVVKKLTA